MLRIVESLAQDGGEAQSARRRLSGRLHLIETVWFWHKTRPSGPDPRLLPVFAVNRLCFATSKEC